MIQLFRPYITEDAINAVSEVLRSGWIGLGPKTQEFEQAFAEYVGVKHAIALNSCTAALHLALIVSGVSDRDEVITTPLTFVSTNHAILYCRATPVFADVALSDCNISPESIVSRITERTKAIICVHYGGYPCDLDTIYAIARDYGLKVIEDAAHAAGSIYRGRHIGAFGLTCFSFHAVKNLPVGDGGMITTNSDEIATSLKRLRWLGVDKDTYARTEDDVGTYAWKYDVSELGYKYHMNDIAATIGLEQLRELERCNSYRRSIASTYDSHLKHPDILRRCPRTPVRTVNSQHLYWIQVHRRDDLVAKLKGNGIAPGVHYLPNNQFQMYKCFRSDTPNAQLVGDTIISLPMHMYLSYADVCKVVEVINGGW